MYRLTCPKPSKDAAAKRTRRPPAIATPAIIETPMPSDFADVTAQSEERPFNLGRTLVDARTMELWRKVSARVFRHLGHDHFGYSDPRGLPALRKAIAEYLRAARAVHCEPGQIVVTARHPARHRSRDPGTAAVRSAGVGRRPRLFADTAGADRRRRQNLSGSGRCSGHQCRRRHQLGAESARRVRYAVAPVPDRRRAVDGAASRTSRTGLGRPRPG